MTQRTDGISGPFNSNCTRIFDGGIIPLKPVEIKPNNEAFEQIKLAILEHKNSMVINNELNQAIIRGDNKLAKWIINKFPRDCTKTSMLLAAKLNNLEIVMQLHTHKHDYCCSSDTIINAASVGNLEIVTWCNTNCTIGTTSEALNIAALNGHPKVVEYLIKARPQDGINTLAMVNAVKNNHTAVIMILRQAFVNIIKTYAPDIHNIYGRDLYESDGEMDYIVKEKILPEPTQPSDEYIYQKLEEIYGEQMRADMNLTDVPAPLDAPDDTSSYDTSSDDTSPYNSSSDEFSDVSSKY